MTQTTLSPGAPASPAPAGPSSTHLVLGRFGETYAARRLIADGLVLLERNWRGAHGEVDLILREGGTLVLCEVKTRTSRSHGHAVEAVGPAKLGRMQALAVEWSEARGVRPVEVRFDIVGVVVDRGVVAEFEHVRGIG